jgi:hypothetical protein
LLTFELSFGTETYRVRMASWSSERQAADEKGTRKKKKAVRCGKLAGFLGVP